MTGHPTPTVGDIARLLAWARHLGQHRSSVTAEELAAFQAAKHALLTRGTNPPAEDHQP